MMSIIRQLGDKHKRPSNKGSAEVSPTLTARRVRLEDILSGCTLGPYSLPNFRLFLKTRERSVENLNFYEWYIIYCTRWTTLEPELRELAPALDHYPSPHHIPYFALAAQDIVPLPPPTSGNSSSDSLYGGGSKGKKSNGSSVSLVHDSFDIERSRPPKVGISVQARIYLGEYSNNTLAVRRPAFISALENALTPDVDELSDSEDDLNHGSHPSTSAATIRVPSRGSSDGRMSSASSASAFKASHTGTSPNPAHIRMAQLDAASKKLKSLSETNLPLASNNSHHRRQPFRTEIDHCVARFFSSFSPDELNIPQQIRQQVVSESKKTTHPAIFEPAFREIIKMLSRSVQDNFLKHADQEYYS